MHLLMFWKAEADNNIFKKGGLAEMHIYFAVLGDILRNCIDSSLTPERVTLHPNTTYAIRIVNHL